MVSNFLYEWNPFNLLGDEVTIDDLMRLALQSDETLVQDKHGHCRRIKAPFQNTNLWDRFVYWVRIHLNEKGHLEAIDKLISVFQEMMLAHPPEEAKHVVKIRLHADLLASLKNDYAFIYLQRGNPHLIDKRLQKIHQLAYMIFAYCQWQQSLEREMIRKEQFRSFYQKTKVALDFLAIQHLSCLQKKRHLMVAPSEMLAWVYEEQLICMHIRLMTMMKIQKEITATEESHQGQFTIPTLQSALEELRFYLCREFQKILVEAEIMIKNLIANYRISKDRAPARKILQALGVNPETSEVRVGLRIVWNPQDISRELSFFEQYLLSSYI